MSKIDEIKKQNPNLTIDVIGVIHDVFKKPKYTEMVINLMKNKNNDLKYFGDLTTELVSEFDFDIEFIKQQSNFQILNIHRVLTDYIGYSNFKNVKKFIELNERKLITNNDLTTYKTFNELELQIALSSLKLIDKSLEKQIQKLYETDEWLIIKPLSFLASKKYGAGTKWCTTSEKNPEYYLRYSQRGILIYCINKLTGNSVAAFKNLDGAYDRETSFWDLIDQRIDSLDSGLPIDVMSIIKEDFTKTKQTNWDLLSDDEKNNQALWLNNEYYQEKIGYDEPSPQPAVEQYTNEEVRSDWAIVNQY
jgi:hypothetical protein